MGREPGIISPGSSRDEKYLLGAVWVGLWFLDGIMHFRKQGGAYVWRANGGLLFVERVLRVNPDHVKCAPDEKPVKPHWSATTQLPRWLSFHLFGEAGKPVLFRGLFPLNFVAVVLFASLLVCHTAIFAQLFQ